MSNRPERPTGVEGVVILRQAQDNNMPFFVYILRSTSNELYIGQTNNLNNREKQQINKTEKAAKFIKDGKEWELVYSEQHETRVLAMRRELQLKGWSRAKKEALISDNVGKLKLLSKSTKTKQKTVSN